MPHPEIQVTLIQLDNYGPWTGTLGSDREYRLQILQSDLYSALQQKFAERNGLAFFNRFDEMLAITNGITLAEHEQIQQTLEERFPVTMSMAIGVGQDPFEAQLTASKLLQQEGSAQSPTRSGVIACERTLTLDNSHVQVMHFDIDKITETLTDHASAYQTSLHVMSLYADLMRRFKEHEALIFFAGGDNFIGVANGLPTSEIESIIQEYRTSNISLKCGIGIARTGRRAAELAAKNLDLIRKGNGNSSILSTTDL
jgi:GTP cyclohydrolase IIa